MYFSSLAGYDFACDPNYEGLSSERLKVFKELQPEQFRLFIMHTFLEVFLKNLWAELLIMFLPRG